MHDPHSLSNHQEVITEHLHLELDVNFDLQIIKGKAIHRLKYLKPTNLFIVDTNGLTIEQVTCGPDEQICSFSLGPKIPHLGQALSIDIQAGTKIINIYFQTTRQAAALQWLEAHQTGGKKHPFLFTQSQAILARSWIPCQDSPSVRFTYTAEVKVPASLMALMSASNPQKINDHGTYHFKMEQPIPSYLLALAVGHLSYQEIDSRTGVYAEPEMIAEASYEFAEMDKMLCEAERLYGKYQWEQFDVLLLPPSFPFGGMENPRLTFATPTIISGDRSLTSLIAHELAHSWSGNLVTNATWNDFWLNEGFTVYFERRIMEQIEGKSYAEMLSNLGYQELLESLHELKNTPDDTRLKLSLENRDPDDGVTNIAYEKGYFFLYTIEQVIGRKAFDKFIKEYFHDFAFQSMSTDKFLEILNSRIFMKSPEFKEYIKPEDWIFKSGLPANFPDITSKRFEKVEAALGKWLKIGDTRLLDFRTWSTHERLYFLRCLPETIDLAKLEDLDTAFELSHSKNAEIFALWAVIAIRHNLTKAYKNIETFLMKIGRRKFLIPIYRALLKNPDTNLMAQKIYKKARPNYHYVSANTLDSIMNEYIYKIP